MSGSAEFRAIVVVVIDPEPTSDVDPDPCPYTFAHTRYWCGNPSCRES